MELKKSTETRQRWKNARRLPYIWCVFLQMEGSLLAFFHLCLVSVLFFSSIPTSNQVLQKLFFPSNHTMRSVVSYTRCAFRDGAWIGEGQATISECQGMYMHMHPFQCIVHLYRCLAGLQIPVIMHKYNDLLHNGMCELDWLKRVLIEGKVMYIFSS